MRTRLIVLLAAVLLVVACAPPEERAADFVAKAQKLYDAGDIQGASVEARNAIQVEPKNAQAYYLMALINEKAGKLAEVIGNLLIAVESDPRNLEAQLKLGTLFFYAEAYDTAATHTAAAAGLAPADSRVKLLQARLAFQKKDYDEGLKLLDGVIATEPENQDALMLKAIVIARTDPAAAIAFIDKALESIDPKKAQALRLVRLNLIDPRKDPAAVEAGLQSLAEDFPEETGYSLQLARMYKAAGRVDEAEKVVRAMVERMPDDVQVRLALVQFLAQVRSPEIAEQTLQDYVEEFPAVPQYRQALGRRYDLTNRTDKALEVYRELAARDPKAPEGLAARREIAKIAFRDGRIAEGRKEIEAIIADSPDDADGLVFRASLRYDAKDYDAAIADLRTALRRQPDYQSALMLLARTYMVTGDATLAADSYRQVLAVNPAHPEAPAELAPILASKGDFAAAADVLQQHLKFAPTDVESLGRLVEIRIQQQDFTTAEGLARQMMEKKNQNGLGDFELGRVLKAQGRFDDALLAFRRALAQRPGDTVVLEGLAQSLVGAKRADEAVRELRGYLAGKPDDTAVKYMLAGVYAASGNVADARALYEELLAAQPRNSALYLSLVNIESDAEGRIATLRRGFAAVPGDASLGMPLAAEYERAGRYEEAISTYAELHDANPKLAEAANNLASLLLDHRTDPASLKRALALAEPFADGKNALYLDTLGWAHYRNGEYAQAVRELESAVTIAGDLPQLRYHLGMAYLAANDPVGAKRELGKALREAKGDFPGATEARDAMARIDRTAGATQR